MSKLYFLGLLFAASVLGSPWNRDAKSEAPHGPAGYGGGDSGSFTTGPHAYGPSSWETTCEASTVTLAATPVTQYSTSTCTETVISSLPGTTVIQTSWSPPSTITETCTSTITAYDTATITSVYTAPGATYVHTETDYKPTTETVTASASWTPHYQSWSTSKTSCAPPTTVTITASAPPQKPTVSTITQTVTASAPPQDPSASTVTVTYSASASSANTITATITESASCSTTWSEHKPSSYATQSTTAWDGYSPPSVYSSSGSAW